MKTFGAWLTLVLGVLLLGASAVGGFAVRDQRRRDDECVSNVLQHVTQIESFHAAKGRLPRREELRGGGIAVINYQIVSSPSNTTQYELTLWRGERAVQYSSITGENSCDSGAWQAALWLGALVLVPGVLLLAWGTRMLLRRAT